MNIQIFGTKKCFDTKKAERYFKERGIKYQFIDMKETGLSKGEYNSIKQAVGGLDKMLNPNCKDKDALALIKYITDEDKGMSKGEFNSVKQAVGGLDNMIDQNHKDKDLLALIKYIVDKEEKVLENQQVIKTPIVRNGKMATIGYTPDIWKKWN